MRFRLTFNKLVSSIVLLLLVSNSVSATTVKEFFKPVPDRAQKLSPDKIYPQGKIFPLSLFSAGGGGALPEKDLQAGLKRVKQDGFTMIGPQYELNHRIIADAKKHGIKCVYTIGLPMNFLGRGGKKTLNLSPEEIHEKIKQQVLEVVKNPEIAWWYLQPEEMRWWRKNEMDYMDAATKAIREADPLKRPIWMYDPNHRGPDGLAHTVKYLDICGKGMYTNGQGKRDYRVWVRSTIEAEIKAIKKANPEAIPIAVPEMFIQPPEELLGMIPRWVRHDVYLSLITGAKGIVVFSMRQRPNFDAHEAYYKAYAQCARELTGPLNLGQVFLFGQRRKDITVTLLEGPKTVTPAKDSKTTYPSVSFLDVAYLKDHYLFLVNSANKPVRVVVDDLPHVRLRVESLFDKKTFLVTEGNFEMALKALEVKAFRFKLEQQR